MPTIEEFRFTKDQITKNPAINIELVTEAERARKELETLGIWKKEASPVRNPFEVKPNPRSHGQKISQLISQSQ